MKFKGKISAVTGASPNISAGIAGGPADEGAKVVCVDSVPENATRVRRLDPNALPPGGS